METLKNINVLFGRLLLASLFLLAGLNKLGSGYAGTQGYMEAMGVSPSLLPMVIGIEIIGALALVIGFKTRLSAFILAGFTLAAAFLFHLNFTDQIQSILFMKNLAIAGGLMTLVTFGAGHYALDARKSQS